MLTGDETGLLKFVNLKRREVVARWGGGSRASEVATTAWLPVTAADVPSSASQAVSMTRAGVIEVWDPATQAQLHSCKNAGSEPMLLACRRGKFITVNKSGELRQIDQGARDAAKKGCATVRRAGD